MVRCWGFCSSGSTGQSRVEIDTTGRRFTQALDRAERQGRAHILGFLQELPGEEASIDLSRVVDVANRLKINLERGAALIDADG